MARRVGPGVDNGCATRKWTPPTAPLNPKTLLLSWALFLAPSLQNELLPRAPWSSSGASRVEFCLIVHQIAVCPDSLPSSTVPRKLLSPQAIDFHWAIATSPDLESSEPRQWMAVDLRLTLRSFCTAMVSGSSF